jgi:hypothetical protein
LITFNANSDTQLKPGDVIEVKLNAHQTESSLSVEAKLPRSLLPNANVLSTDTVNSRETPSTNAPSGKPASQAIGDTLAGNEPDTNALRGSQ